MPVYFQAMLPFTLPPAPSGLTAVANSSSQITLNFTTNNPGLTTYLIYICSGIGCTPHGNPVATIGPIVAASLSQPISGLSPLTSYSFWVIAQNAAGLQSFPSNTENAVTQGTGAPSAPGSLNAVTASAFQINLTWTAS